MGTASTVMVGAADWSALRRTPWVRPAASAAPARRRAPTTVSAPTP